MRRSRFSDWFHFFVGIIGTWLLHKKYPILTHKMDDDLPCGSILKIVWLMHRSLYDKIAILPPISNRKKYMPQYSVSILPIAEECLERLHEYFVSHSAHYAHLFQAEIVHIVYDVLALNPYAGRAIDKNPEIREFVCPASRYVIRYSFIRDRIIIRSVYKSRWMWLYWSDT
jgi:hypothetical protein